VLVVWKVPFRREAVAVVDLSAVVVEESWD
jgi:hypothetical protein